MALASVVICTISTAQTVDARSAADHAVACTCTSPSNCPSLGTFSVGNLKPQKVYCNQLNGSENPGIRTDDAWTFQCVELANRWLMESVGTPLIRGNADQLCDNAQRSSYDVHFGSSNATYEPVAGDLIVWTGSRMGHVGIVSSVSPSTITFVNQNYGYDGKQYPILTVPRVNGFFGNPLDNRILHPRCFIHPRKLGPSSFSSTMTPTPPTQAPSTSASSANPCANVTAGNDGTYCGASRQSSFAGGDDRTLFMCSGGRTVASMRCRRSCVMERAGVADHCF